MAELAAPVPEERSYRWVALPLLAFALVSLTAGLLASHEPGSKGYFRLFFSDPLHLKAGFATAAAVLACFQLFTAAWIFRKLPWRKPAWVNPVHRWSGRLAFVCTLPVAYHCIFKLGFRHPSDRVLPTRCSAAPCTERSPRRSRSCGCIASRGRCSRSPADCSSPP